MAYRSRSRTRSFVAISFALVAACGDEKGSAGLTDAPTASDSPTVSDAPAACAVFVTFDPPAAIATPETQIIAKAGVLNAQGVVGYTWQVKRAGIDVDYTFAQADESWIRFDAPTADAYDVMVAVDAPGEFCPTGHSTINVAMPGANMAQVRMRVIPPSSIAAPPNEKLVLVMGGASFSLGLVSVDPGVVAQGQVMAGGTPIPAYLRFIPLGARDAYVEAFSSPTGAYSARVLNQLHDVLVIPLVAGYAPKLQTNWTPGVAISVVPGNTVTGIVRDRSGTPLAGAKVHMTIGEVPTTLTTTLANGTFTVRSIPIPAGATITVEVTPPAASGLPRLTASSSAFDLGQQVQVQYSASLALRDLGGVSVRRGGTPQAGAQVDIVGTLAAGGTITTGATNVPATGEVRLAVTANGAGALPSPSLAPAAPLSAVVTLGPTDHAVAAIDLTGGVPATIDAPAMISKTTQLRSPTSTLAGATLEVLPIGALAMAGVGYARATSGANGMVTLPLAAGGHYDLRLSDPAGRASPLVVGDVTTASMVGTYTLLPALQVSGTLALSGNPIPVGRAAIQILCTNCTGVDRTRPLAEGSSTGAGDFAIAVFDPGTM